MSEFGYDPANLSSQSYVPYYGFEGMPSTGLSPTVDMMSSLLLPMLAQQMSAGTDFRFMGLTGESPYRVMRKQQQTRIHDAFMAAPRSLPQLPYQNMLLGAASMMGVEATPESVAAAGRLGDMLNRFEPQFAAMAPQLLDRLSGERGSESVFREYMFRGLQLRPDAVNPDMRQRTAESLRGVSDRVFQSMYGDDTFERGSLSAGTAGQLFASMQTRGMVAGISDAERNALSGLTGAEQDAKLQMLDVTKIKDVLKQHTETVKAIQEIFAAGGKPDAPMGQLIQTLQSLAGQSMGSVRDPKTLAKRMRGAFDMAERGGLSLDGMLAVQSAASQQAAQAGLGVGSGMFLGDQALAFRVVAQQQGLVATGMTPNGIEQLTALQQQALAGGAASNVANQVAVAQRLAGSEALKPDSPLAKYLEAVQSGQTTFNGRSIEMNNAEFVALAAESGLSATETDIMLGQTAFNRDYDSRNGFTGAYAARAVQPEEFFGTKGATNAALPAAMASLDGAVARAGITDGNVRVAAAREASQAAFKVMRSSAYRSATQEERQQMLRDAVSSSLSNTDASLGAAVTAGELARLTDNIVAEGDVYAKERGFAGVEEAALVYGEGLFEQTRQVEQNAAAQADIESTFSTLFGDATPLRNMVDTLVQEGMTQDARERDPDAATKLFFSAVGAVDNDKLKERFKAAADNLVLQHTELQKLIKENKVSGPEAVRRQKALDAAAKELQQLSLGFDIGDTESQTLRKAGLVAVQQQLYAEEQQVAAISDEDKRQALIDESGVRSDFLNAMLEDEDAARRVGPEMMQRVVEAAATETSLSGGNGDASTLSKQRQLIRDIYSAAAMDQQFSYLSGAEQMAMGAATERAVETGNYRYVDREFWLRASQEEFEAAAAAISLGDTDRAQLTSAREAAAEANRIRQEAVDAASPLTRANKAFQNLTGSDKTLSRQELENKMGRKNVEKLMQDDKALGQFEAVTSDVDQYFALVQAGRKQEAEEFAKTRQIPRDAIEVRRAAEAGTDASKPADSTKSIEAVVEKALASRDIGSKDMALTMTAANLTIDLANGTATLTGDASMSLQAAAEMA